MTPEGAVVVGIGNPILTDDAVGLVVARRVHELLDLPGLELRELCAGGVELMEVIFGFRAAVIIDAIMTRRGEPGTLYRIDITQANPAFRAGASHEIGLVEGLELGRRLGMAVPDHVRLFAVEVSDPLSFGSRMSEAVAKAVPEAAAAIAAEVRPLLARETLLLPQLEQVVPEDSC